VKFSSLAEVARLSEQRADYRGLIASAAEGAVTLHSWHSGREFNGKDMLGDSVVRDFMIACAKTQLGAVDDALRRLGVEVDSNDWSQVTR
jgi:hypothetical protein